MSDHESLEELFARKITDKIKSEANLLGELGELGDNLLTALNVSQICKISRSSSYQLIRGLPHIKIGRSIRIRASVLKLFLEQQITLGQQQIDQPEKINPWKLRKRASSPYFQAQRQSCGKKLRVSTGLESKEEAQMLIDRWNLKLIQSN